MYMIEFKNKWRFIIGVTFIVSTSILVIGILSNIYKSLYNKYSNFKFKKNSNKLLNSLDMYKKTIVYKELNKTHELPLNDGAVVFLEYWMQYAVEDLINTIFPYFLQPWVVDKLNEDLLLTYFKSMCKDIVAKSIINY